MTLDLAERPAAVGTERPAAPLLSVENLSVAFDTPRGIVRAVDNVSYVVNPGEVLAIVGESGCGKSVSALALMRLLPRANAKVSGTRVLFDGVDLLKLSDEEIRQRRGRDIGMIFQEPMTSLNPTMTVGAQIIEPLAVHLKMAAQQARARALELLTLVGMTDPERRLDQYPHELSGGMRQRAMIAIAIACDPKLLIADEPTTALDVTIQAQILELLKDLSRRLGIAIIFITHNLGVVARYADRVAVMYAARQIEAGEAADVFARPHHPYTHGLLRAVPRLDQPRKEHLETIEGMPPDLLALPPGCRFAPRCGWRIERCAEEPPRIEVGNGQVAACWRAKEVGAASGKTAAVAAESAERRSQKAATLVRLEGLSKHYQVTNATLKAVDDVTLDIARGETLGLVGESGCGKTTIGRMITWLEKPTAGRIVFEGDEVVSLRGDRRRDVRRQIQAVFQDPFSSLNPRMRIEQILSEPLSVYRLEPNARAIRDKVIALLADVGLPGYMAERFPHELSGGQRQRVGIARTLAMQPRFIVCDEPVSALDVSIQGQVIGLLERLQAERDLTFLFIAHDLSVVRHIADRVGVMYLGKIMELAPSDELFRAPLHPYTKALIEAVPVPDPAVEKSAVRKPLAGEIPSPLNPPSGCYFRTRCPQASAECASTVPPLREHRPGHFAACIKI